MEQKITIFTDGSSLGNPGPGGWGAIIIFPPGEDDDSESKVESRKSKVIELGGYENETTNNRMEMTAAIKALAYVCNLQPTTYNLQLYTDSSYVLNGITKWIHGWHQNNWKTKSKEDVLNKDLWQKLFSLVYSNDLEIDWQLVKGHVGIVGNERADLIATSFAEGKPIKPFEGFIEDYEKMLGESILKVPEEAHEHPKRSHKKAYSYVSFVDRKIETHKTWAECEKRAKGQSGARFKKAVDKADEKRIIEEFEKGL